MRLIVTPGRSERVGPRGALEGTGARVLPMLVPGFCRIQLFGELLVSTNGDPPPQSVLTNSAKRPPPKAVSAPERHGVGS